MKLLATENTKLVCEDCEAEVGCVIETSDGDLCQDCIDAGGYEECDECGTWNANCISVHSEGRWRRMENLCPDCYEGECCQCESCGEHAHVENMRTLPRDNGAVCEQCFQENYYTCGCCGEAYEQDDGVTVNDGEALVCQDCYEEFYTECSECEEMFHRDNMHRQGSRRYCDGCWEEMERDPSIPNVHDHSFRPRPRFLLVHGESQSTTMTYGVELETENKVGTHEWGDLLEEINPALNDGGCRVYYKYDGSLYNGVEFVTMPFSWQYMIENPGWLDPIFNLRLKGIRSYNTETCGLHIHMTKALFKPSALYKFLKFFYDNKDYVVYVSRRRTDKFNQWARIGDNAKDHKNLRYESKNKYKCDGSGRYSCINLENDRTIEIRMFRGTLDKAGFMHSLEFLKSLYEYSNDSKTRVKDVAVPHFLEYLDKHSVDYPHVHRSLVVMKDTNIEQGRRA